MADFLWLFQTCLDMITPTFMPEKIRSSIQAQVVALLEAMSQLPDPQSRIQRSGAAQPILDAIRNRSLRDPVRSAIERLTGAAPAETPPAAAAPALAGSSAPADERPADSGSMPGKADSEPHQDTR